MGHLNKQPLKIGNLYIYQRGEDFKYIDLIVGFNSKLERFSLLRISYFHNSAWYQEINPEYYEGFFDDAKPIHPQYYKDFIRFLFETEDYVWEQNGN